MQLRPQCVYSQAVRQHLLPSAIIAEIRPPCNGRAGFLYLKPNRITRVPRIKSTPIKTPAKPYSARVCGINVFLEHGTTLGGVVVPPRAVPAPQTAPLQQGEFRACGRDQGSP